MIFSRTSLIVCYGSHWFVIYFDVISIVRLIEKPSCFFCSVVVHHVPEASHRVAAVKVPLCHKVVANCKAPCRGLLLALFCQIWRELDFGRSLQTDDDQDICCGACRLLELCKAGLLRGPLYVATVETRELLTTFFSTSHFPFFFKLSPLCICSNDQPTCEIDRDGVRRDR